MIKSLQKKITLQITCADSNALLNALICEQIPLEKVKHRGDIVIELTVDMWAYERVCGIAEKRGASVKVLQKTGLLWQADTLLKRPVLPVIILLLLITSAFLPSRVFFISVSGNTSVPDHRILEAAADCGLVFGVSGRSIRNEELKNALLESVPELNWVGINTHGCTAVISVKEKTPVEEITESENQVCSIVAIRDGIIQNCTVYKGNPLCTVGQAVSAGQTLVSGYSDYGLLTKATRASAEIRALTVRNLELVSPAATGTRGEIYRKISRYSLKIGKKVIKFYKDSGNLDATCAKIYLEEYVQLPGGFQLPISVIKETQILYHTAQESEASAENKDWLEAYARTYLQSSMVAGEIISEETELDLQSQSCQLSGKYTCMEMIGRIKYEQMMIKDVKNE